jgi:hypothetical protein
LAGATRLELPYVLKAVAARLPQCIEDSNVVGERLIREHSLLEIVHAALQKAHDVLTRFEIDRLRRKEMELHHRTSNQERQRAQ